METYGIMLIQFFMKRHKTLLRIAAVMAKIGYWVYIIYGIYEWFRPGAVVEKIRRRNMLWQCFFSVLTGSVFSFIAGKIFYRRRPFAAHPGIEAIIPHTENASFPSNHAMNGMAVTLQLLRHGNRMGWFFLPWTICIGLSRVICGIHYATDILCGFLFGAASAGIVCRSVWIRKAGRHLTWYWHVLETVIAAWYARR